MARKRIEVTDTELSILTVLWERGSATIREITDELYSKESTAAQYATVQKLLERLESKGCVSRDRRSFAHVFKPKVKRSALIDQGLESLARKLCNGSLTPLLTHLAGRTELSPSEREAIRKLIDSK